MASVSIERQDERRGEQDGVVSLTIPARPEYIALCRLALTGLARAREFSPEVVADLKLALTEACSNSVRHAYDEGREGVVEIRYELEADRIAIEVCDEGAGFDPDVLNQIADEVDEGGLGIAIIRALSDEFEVGRRPQGGSRLRFTKSIS